MLLLLFEIRDGRFALPTERIVTIVPYVRLKKIPKAPDYVAGIMNYRGTPVPVIDLSSLSEGTPCKYRFSTRIILVAYPYMENQDKLLGLIAERITETAKIKQTTIPSSGILMDDALYTGKDDGNKDEMVQWFDLVRMIPAHMVKDLFQD